MLSRKQKHFKGMENLLCSGLEETPAGTGAASRSKGAEWEEQ
jgi:hypothetical protein